MSSLPVLHGIGNLSLSSHVANQANTQRIGFFDFPPEVRNIMYGVIVDRLTSNDTVVRYTTRSEHIVPMLPSHIRNFLLSSRHIERELLPLIFRKHIWSADLRFTQVDDNAMCLLPGDSWLRAPNAHGELLDGNVRQVRFRMVYRLPRSETCRAEKYWKVDKGGANGRIDLSVDIQLSDAMPHSHEQVTSSVQLSPGKPAAEQLAMQLSLQETLRQTVVKSLSSLVTAKVAAGDRATDFALADWNQILDDVKEAYVAWFLGQDWRPWRPWECVIE